MACTNVGKKGTLVKHPLLKEEACEWGNFCPSLTGLA
jgi:hypothetical protein